MTRHLRTKDPGKAEAPRPVTWRSSRLWQQLRAMRIAPEGAALTFAARLGRENGWSPAHAGAVIEEYRRFLYLAATSRQSVTPPEDVDQAWHLHLSYTRHYWDVLCARLLGRPLHHEPTAGGRDEAARHLAQYQATLSLYRETFGASPPAGIWPAVGERFTARPQWVDRARYWLVPKALTGGAGALTAATILLAACTTLAANNGTPGSGVSVLAILAIFVILIVGALALARLFVRDKGFGGGGCGGGGGSGGDTTGGDSNGCGAGGCGGGCGS